MLERWTGWAERTALGSKMMKDLRFRRILPAAVNMGWNLVYAVFNAVLGIAFRSAWFATLSAYYALLGFLKLNVLKAGRRGMDDAAERTVMLQTGAGLIALAVLLALIVRLTIHDDMGRRYDIAIMIGLAAVTFTSAGMAIKNAVQAHRRGEAVWVMLRNISLAAAVGAMLSLERSMLSTFSDRADRFKYIMEGATGMGGFLIVVGIGTAMIIAAQKRGQAPRL